MRPGARGVGFDRTKISNTEPQPVKPQPRVRAEDYAPSTTGPMDIDTARWEKKCRHCRQPWELNHTCEKKKAAQVAYQERTAGRWREIQMESNKEEIARLKDELDVMKKELEEVKEEGD